MISSIIRAAMRRKPCPSSELIIRGWNNTGSEGGFHERLPRKGPRRHVISGRKPEDHGAGSWNRGRDQGVGRQRKIRSDRNPMGRRAILRLAQPLSPVEYDLRPDGRKPHRFRSDSLHLHPLLPSPSARNGGKHGLTPANRFLAEILAMPCGARFGSGAGFFSPSASAMRSMSPSSKLQRPSRRTIQGISPALMVRAMSAG